MARSGYEHLCQEETRRGGYTEGGGYDRMNSVRYEPCFKPSPTAVEFFARNGQRTMCKRHANLRRGQIQTNRAKAAEAARVLVFHDEGAHVGGERQWARRCAKCAAAARTPSSR